MKSYFKNPDGFNLKYCPELSTWWTTVYHFTLDRNSPLAFVDNDDEWQPNRSYHTDQGSIPRFPGFIRMFWPKDRFLGFYIHDSGYTFGGLFKNGKFISMTRKQVDDLLFKMVLNDPNPGLKTSACIIWTEVRKWGWMSWLKGDKGKPEKTINPYGTNGIIRLA